MKAIELSGMEGLESLRVVDVEKPNPGANQVLIEVKAAGVDFAEIELTQGRYPALKPLPYFSAHESQESIRSSLEQAHHRQGGFDSVIKEGSNYVSKREFL